jgi:hemoglobin
MKRFALAFAFATLVFVPPAQANGTLYSELGGYDAVAAVTDGLLAKLVADPSLGRFFVGHSESSGKRTRQMIVDFLCEKTGGPCYYTGRSMKDIHTGLKISEADWNAAAGMLVATLKEHNVPQPLQDKVVEFVVSLKPDIVGQ